MTALVVVILLNLTEHVLVKALRISGAWTDFYSFDHGREPESSNLAGAAHNSSGTDVLCHLPPKTGRCGAQTCFFIVLK